MKKKWPGRGKEKKSDLDGVMRKKKWPGQGNEKKWPGRGNEVKVVWMG